MQLDEIGFADASGSQLGVGTVAPVVSPQYQKKDQERASMMVSVIASRCYDQQSQSIYDQGCLLVIGLTVAP